MSGAVAVGVFDGLHLGHLAILERVRARSAGGSCTALSFDPHPDVVLRANHHHHWQKRSMEAISLLAPGLVTVET